MKTKQDYFIGLDIGTSSVGWSVTDTDTNLIKVKNKNFWGVRRFEAGKTAEERRLHRSTRRRYQRRRQRIQLLQNFFHKEVTNVDESFFEKLNTSWIHKEDQNHNKVADFIFYKNQPKEKESFYNQFPSIWHLRKFILENPEAKIDIRYIYLAIHHIIKYRGNFLYTDSEFKQTETAIEVELERLTEYLEETYDVEIDIDQFTKIIKYTLSDSTITTAQKKERLLSYFKNYKTISRQLTQITNAILVFCK